MPQPNDMQNARLAALNDSYTVERYEMEGGILHIWTDDDEAEVYPDGTVLWRSAS